MSELLTKQGEHLAEILNAIDGDGERFQFGTLYYYLEMDEKFSIKSVETKYSALALSQVSHVSPVTYRIDESKKINVNSLFRSPEKCAQIGVFEIEKRKEQILITLQTAILETLQKYQEQMRYFSEMKAQIESDLREFIK